MGDGAIIGIINEKFFDSNTIVTSVTKVHIAMFTRIRNIPST